MRNPWRGRWAGPWALVAVLLWVPVPGHGALPGKPEPVPQVRIVIAPADATADPRPLVARLRAEMAATPWLAQRVAVQSLAKPVAPADTANPAVARALRSRTGNATFLIWTAPPVIGRDGDVDAPARYLIHLYTLDPAHQAQQAAGDRVIVPTLHRLPNLDGDDSLAFVTAIQAATAIYLGDFPAARTILDGVATLPDLTPAERYPLAFFLALAELAEGTQTRDGERVGRALYRFGALRAALAEGSYGELAGAVAANRAIALARTRSANPTANLDRAVAAFAEALVSYPVQRAPMIHARLLHQLGTVQQRYPDDADGGHLLQAIQAYQAALKVWTPASHPAAYRAAVHNIALCFQRLPVGDIHRNRLTAVNLYLRLLAMDHVQTRADLRAITLSNLGQAYQTLPVGNGDNLRRAVIAYRDALGVWTLAQHPKRAGTLHKLAGTALEKLSRLDGRPALLEALRHYDRALVAAAERRDNMDAALVQVKRGSVLAALPPPNRAKALELAEQALTSALSFLTPDNLPYYHPRVVKLRDRVVAERRDIAAAPTTSDTPSQLPTGDPQAAP